MLYLTQPLLGSQKPTEARRLIYALLDKMSDNDHMKLDNVEI